MEKGGTAAKKYPCNFCDRVFVTAQALGGHQNSHRSERESIKMSRQDGQFRPMQMAPPPSPFPQLTIQTSNPKMRHVPMLSEYNRHYTQQTYVPNRVALKEFYYHPYAHRPLQWKNHYVVSRYPSSSMPAHMTSYGNLRSIPRYPFVFPRGASSQRHQNLRLQPQNYELFPQNNGCKSRNDYQINMNSSISIAGDKKEDSAGPSVAVTLNHVGEKREKDAEVKHNDADGELDLTLHRSAGPSVVVTLNQVDEQKGKNAEVKRDDANDELDLTLHL